MMPVPTRFRIPSASVMIREIRTPERVPSKKRIGRRVTRSCTRRRMSMIAPCAATLTTCAIAKVDAACTTVAPATAATSGTSSSARPAADHVVDEELRAARQHEAGEAVHDHQAKPMARPRRYCQRSCFASRHAPAGGRFTSSRLGGWGGPAVQRGRRDGGRRTRGTTAGLRATSSTGA
jgi:hypothetical protein